MISDSTDYVAGLTTKGNGLTINGTVGNDAGFFMYKATNIFDVAIDFVEVYHGCRLDYYMLSVGKTVTSVPGVLNTATNFLWRALGDEDKDLYTTISAGLNDNDKIAVGSGFG